MTFNVGTELYMSPEAKEGRYKIGKSDVYSLGLVLYFMCTHYQPP